jgi:uncharacterized GH25 family protein
MKKLIKLSAVLLLSLSCGQALAHHFWLLPSSTVLAKEGYVTVDAAVSNDMFYFNYNPLRLQENFAAIAPDGSTIALENQHQGKFRTSFDLNLSQSGTYRIGQANSGIMASWKQGEQTRRFRGDAAAFAERVPKDAVELRVTESLSRLETFVTVGKPSALKPVGVGIELIPVTHVNDLVAGETAVFRFHVDGKPQAGLEVSVVRGGTRYRNLLEKIELKSDDKGEVRILWPHAGLYLLEAKGEDQKTSLKEAESRRLAYAGMFEVLPQ